MGVRRFVSRLVMIALVSLPVVWLAATMSPWAALGIWAAGAAVVCGGIGLLMHTQTAGKVTFVNHLAGYFLLWGFVLGRGKLLPIALESWIRWVLLGSAIILATMPAFHPNLGVDSHGQSESPTYQRSATMGAMLAVSWTIDGAVLLRLITGLASRAKTNPIRINALGPLMGMGFVIVISIALATIMTDAVRTGVALLVSAGPIVVLGGGYGIFILAMVVFGPKTRWN